MKKTMELSEVNTNVLRKALKVVDEDGVKEIVKYSYDCAKNNAVAVFELGLQQKSSGFLNDDGETCYIYLNIGVQKGPFSEKRPRAVLLVTYVTANNNGEEFEIDYKLLTGRNSHNVSVLEAVNGREIVFAKDTGRELHLKLKLADDLI